MAKQWYSFSAPEPGENVAKPLSRKSWISKIILLVALTVIQEGGVFAQGEDAGFLNLPAYDLQWDSVNPKEEVQVGDAVPLKIAGSGASSASSELSLAPAPGSPDLSESGWSILPSSPSQGGPTDFTFKAVPMKEGSLTLPALAIQDKEGKAIGRTRPFSLKVLTSIQPDDPKPKEPAPAEPPVSLSFPIWVVILITLLGVGLFVGLGFLLYRYWKNRPKPVVVETPVRVLPEDEEALSELLKIENAGWIEKGQFKTYYFRVSETMKNYIGRRYRCDALESTTREMLLLLEHKKGLDDLLLDELEKNFEALDLVKFTDFVPSDSESKDLLDWARKFVLKTRKPKVDVSTAGPAPSLPAGQLGTGGAP
ncbi:MAG: hypothetical protein HYX41_08005 [Bdellovibrio sp.]|nr:hypothetical protein [Bdellovibrio sp.]